MDINADGPGWEGSQLAQRVQLPHHATAWVSA
jgi:hypothetical protein